MDSSSTANVQLQELEAFFRRLELSRDNDIQHTESSVNQNSPSYRSSSTVELTPHMALIDELLDSDEHLMYPNQETDQYLRTMMLVDQQMRALQIAVDSCEEDRQLRSLVERILSDELFFMNALIHKQGSTCIIKIIKKLKTTNYASILTQSLAALLYQIMTHPTARIVVQKCFIYLGEAPNRVLYEQAISYVLELATNKVGCLSLNECLDTISGSQRLRILNLISYFSDSLAKDTHGNFVVQHVLEMGNNVVNDSILRRLRGQFVRLSQTKEGSHVVEKCLEYCYFGELAVVQEMLMDGAKGACLLAKHPFGNYVVQKALKKSKASGHVYLHEALVDVIMARRREVESTMGGRCVMNLIEDEISLERIAHSVRVSAFPSFGAINVGN